MPLVLPHVHVDRRKRLITESRPEVLTANDRAVLLNVDWDLQRSTRNPGDRIQPLANGRWAVGRGVDNGTVWRIVDMPDLEPLRHPAWLWTEDDWFGLAPHESGPAPRRVALKKTLRQAARMTQSTRKTNRLVAAVVAHLRHPDRRPLAVVASETQLLGPIHAARWFALALIGCMPSEITLDLRIGCMEPAPDPRQWDLVLTADPPEGFDVIDADRAPNVGDDLVAWYIRRRLLDGEPELVEAIASLWEEDAADPWQACLEKQLAADGTARIGLDKDTLVESPDVARQLVVARVQGGAAIDGRLANEIAAVTIKSGGADLWHALATRDEQERTRVFRAWLASAHRYPPDDELLDAVGEVRPPGAQASEWLTALLRWFSMGQAPAAAVHQLQRTLEEDAEAPDLASRASVWLELMAGLLRAGRADEVVAGLASAAARRLIDGGASRAVVHAWLLLPAEDRTEAELRELLRRIAAAADADRAVAVLWTTLRHEGQPELAGAVVRHWAEHLGRTGPRREDRFAATLAATPEAELWVRTVVVSAEHRHLPSLLLPAIGQQSDLWLLAESEWTRARSPIPRDRFVAMYAYLPHAAPVLEVRARDVLAEALTTCTFPDADLADVASAFAEGPGASPLWMWVAVAASAPDQFDTPTIDATVHAFCNRPPVRPDEREIGQICARRLGFAAEWEPLDHARWLVRLTLAPDGDASGYNLDLALAMLKSMLNRVDGMDRMVILANAILELPPDHEALHFFIEDLLPRLWQGGPPDEFVRRVPLDKQPTEIRSAWRAAFGRW